MVTYPFNMIDMGGIDLAEICFEKIDGIYDSIVEALNDLGEVVIYNWKFGEVLIAPGYYEVIEDSNGLLIGGVVRVTEDDRVGVEGIEPVFGELSVTENGEYFPEAADGFSKVTVAVPNSVTELSVSQNGEYLPQSPNIGFSSVEVSVPNSVGALSVTENGTYTPESPNIGFSQVSVQVPNSVTPLSVSENGTYTPASPHIGFSEVVVDVQGTLIPETPYGSFGGGYVGSNGTYYAPASGGFNDGYDITVGHIYLLCLGAFVGTKFYASQLLGKPTGDTWFNITGDIVIYVDNPSQYSYVMFTATRSYLAVTKDYANRGVKTYLYDMTTLIQGGE